MIRLIQLYHIVLIPVRFACPVNILFYKLLVWLTNIRKSCLSVMKMDFIIHKLLTGEKTFAKMECAYFWRSRS